MIYLVAFFLFNLAIVTVVVGVFVGLPWLLTGLACRWLTARKGSSSDD